MNIIEAKRKYGLSAGWKYSSGKLHAAWDIRTPTGVELHADTGGLVRDLNDGVPNNPPGRNPGSGAASNWVLLHIPYAGGTATVLINHLSPGLKVRKGQRIGPGTLLGISGNSGNSTGPHTHVAAFKGQWSGPYRYQYLKDTSLIIWEPDKVLTQAAAAPTTPAEEEDDMSAADVWATPLESQADGGTYRADAFLVSIDRKLSEVLQRLDKLERRQG